MGNPEQASGWALHYLGRWLAEQQRCDEAVPLLRRVARLPAASWTLEEAGIAEIDRLLANCSAGRPVTTETLD